MKCLLRLALLAGLALAGSAAPAFAHGAFGLFYARCTGCCAGCPRPWNAFSDGSAPSTCYGQVNGFAQMPCLPYQGPGDPFPGMYASGDPNAGCGVGGPVDHDTPAWLAKLHGLFGHGHHGKYGESDDDIGIGFDTGRDSGQFPGSCGPGGCAPAGPAYQGAHPVSYPNPHVPVQYQGYAPGH